MLPTSDVRLHLSTPVCVWLPDPTPTDTPVFRKFIGWLKEKLRQEHRHVLISLVGTEETPDKDGPVFVYYPETGWSDRQHARLFREIRHAFFMRFFEEQTVLPGETSPAECLRSQAYYDAKTIGEKSFCCFPFLGTNNPSSFRRCLAWMNRCVAFVHCVQAGYANAQRISNHDLLVERFRSTAAQRLGSFKKCNVHSRWLSVGRVANGLLAIREKLEVNQRSLKEKSLRHAERITKLADGETRRTLQFVTRSERIASVPMPLNHLKLLNTIDRFVRTCDEAGIESASRISASLRSIIDKDIPVLCVVGPFSSGKTTLLNSVLLGEKKSCAFATKHVANTSVIYDIRRVGTHGKELARIEFHRDVSILVYKVNEQDQNIATWPPQKIPLLLQWIGRGDIFADENLILEEEIIRSVNAIDNSEKYQRRDIRITKLTGKKMREILEKIGCREPPGDVPAEESHAKDLITRRHLLRRRRILRMDFNAQVLFADHAESDGVLDALGLFREIRLETPEDWAKFRGDELQANPRNPRSGLETDAASLFIKRVFIELDSPILRFIRVADTPGLGSSRPIHDEITERYLQSAEGFVVMLPGKGQQFHQKIQETFQLLKQFVDLPSRNVLSFLDRTAFIINLWRDDKPKEVYDYYSREIQKHFNTPGSLFRTNLFVVNLKKPSTLDAFEPESRYKSLRDFAGWLESDLLRRGAFSARFGKVNSILTNGWREEERSLEWSIAQLKRDIKRRMDRAQELRDYRDCELPGVLKRHLSGITNICRAMDDIIHKFKTSDARTKFTQHKHKKCKIDTLRKVVQQSYDEINDMLDTHFPAESSDANLEDSADRDPAQRWFAELEAGCEGIGIAPPPRTPPAYGGDFHPKHRLTMSSIDRQIQDIYNSWPFWEWWDNLWGGKDRCEKAKNVFKTAIHEMRLLASSTTKYLNEVSDWIKQCRDDLTGRLDAEIEALTDESLITSTITKKQAELESLKKLIPERDKLVSQLQNFL